MKKPRVCIVGAGSSGLPAIKAMVDAGLPITCFEMGDRVGGNWVFGNTNGISNIYRSLHINTSRERMAYFDLPMPDHYPDYPGHEQIAAYFDQYVDHFGLRSYIRFHATVTSCRRDPASGVWTVCWRDADGAHEDTFDMLIVANGHHWDPQLPDPPFPGTFNGEQFHSHAYVDPTTPVDTIGKDVLVVGMGNSAMDIATELGRKGIASTCYLAARRGAWVIPKYLFGKPVDQLPVNNPLLHPAVPYAIRGPLLSQFLKRVLGPMSSYGLPDPAHEPDEAHPTISGELPLRVGSGDVHWVGNISRLDGDHVVFEDGTRRHVDVIIWCTGYRVTFPFFDEAFIAAPDNDLPLFRRVFKPGIPNLAFVGLLQPLGAIMPLADAQSKWIADLLLGRYALPSDGEMLDDIAREREAMFKRYVASRRHTMQVDFDEYLWQLGRERRRGERRAQRQR